MVARGSIFLSSSVLLLASACAAPPKEPPASAAMAPAAQAAVVAGTRFVVWDHRADKEFEWVVDSVGPDGSVSGTASDGCSFVLTELGIGPARAWTNCPDDMPQWRSGTNTITGHDGALFPLAVGNVESWSFTSRSSTGESGDEKRVCTVAATVRITTRTGERDAFKVLCDSKWHTLTAYVDADGYPIRDTFEHKQRGVQWDNEVLSIEPPAA